MITIALKEKALKNMFIVMLVVALTIPGLIALVIHPQYKQAVVDNAEKDAVVLASHLMNNLIQEKILLDGTPLDNQAYVRIESIITDFDLFKLKIFSSNGAIRFSNDRSEIGLVNRKDYFRNIVAKGHTYTKVVRKDNPSLEDQLVSLDVVECYVPIMISNTFGGAFEIYYDVTSRFNRIERLQSKTNAWVFSFTAFIVLLALLALQHSGKYLQDRAIARRALSESEEKFKSISASLNDALITIDHHGEITFWNGAAERIFGYQKDEVLGKKLHPLLAPARWQSAYEKGFSAFTSTGKGPAIGRTLELTALRKDGREFPIEISLAAYQAGDHWQAVGTVRDISDREVAEQEKAKLIKDLQKALKDVKQLSGLVPICSHCKSIRDDEGYWNRVESYLAQRSDMNFSHGICPDCLTKHYPEVHLQGD